MLPIPGTGSVDHLEENIAAAELVLDPAEVAAITHSHTASARSAG
jgi:aryl-alcohol dehydrogenase-like predicted oxidoreductase